MAKVSLQRWLQDSDPGGSASYGEQWLHSNGTLRERTQSGTWSVIGNVLTTNMGLVATSGANMTGALTGVTGWAPVASPNFTTSAQRAGINLVDQNELTAAINALEASIDSRVSEAVSSIVDTSVSFGNNFAVATGELTPSPSYNSTVTVPKPTYANGETPADDECTVMVAPADWGTSLVELGGDATKMQSLVKQNGTKFQYQSYNITVRGNYAMKMRYLVIASR